MKLKIKTLSISLNKITTYAIKLTYAFKLMRFHVILVHQVKRLPCSSWSIRIPIKKSIRHLCVAWKKKEKLIHDVGHHSPNCESERTIKCPRWHVKAAVTEWSCHPRPNYSRWLNCRLGHRCPQSCAAGHVGHIAKGQGEVAGTGLDLVPITPALGICELYYLYLPHFR